MTLSVDAYGDASFFSNVFFSHEENSRLPSQWSRVPKEQVLRKLYPPSVVLGSGTFGTVYASHIQYAPGPDGPFHSILINSQGDIQQGPAGVIDPTQLPVGTRQFVVAVKLVLTGFEIDYANPEHETAVNEAKIQKYVTELSVGSGSEVFTVTPVNKMFDWMRATMTLREFADLYIPTVMSWTTVAMSPVGATAHRFHPNFQRDPLSVVRVYDPTSIYRRSDASYEKAFAPYMDLRIVVVTSILDVSYFGNLSMFINRKSILYQQIVDQPALNFLAGRQVYGKVLTMMLIHCLAQLHMLHTVAHVNHFDSRTPNFLMHALPGSAKWARYRLARNVTFYLPTDFTVFTIPTIADFGMAAVGERDLDWPDSVNYGVTLPPTTNFHSRVGLEPTQDLEGTVEKWNPAFDMQVLACSFVGSMQDYDMQFMPVVFYRMIKTMLSKPGIESLVQNPRDQNDPMEENLMRYTDAIQHLDTLIAANDNVTELAKIKNTIAKNAFNDYTWRLTRPLPNDPTPKSVFLSHWQEMKQFTVIPSDPDQRIVDLTIHVGNFDPDLWDVPAPPPESRSTVLDASPVSIPDTPGNSDYRRKKSAGQGKMQ